MNHLVLLRHGRTEGTERHLYYGATDLPLLPIGVEELKDFSARGIYPDPNGFRLMSSGMLRANETLRTIFGDVPYCVEPEFRETNFGIFEMKSYDELKDTPAYQSWLAGDWYQNTPPGGESFGACDVRIQKALDKLLSEPEDTILVCHGGTILVMMQMLFPEEKKTGYEWQPKPGLGYAIDLAAHTYRSITP